MNESERAVGWLSYDEQKPMPDAKVVEDFSSTFDDMALVPYDKQPVLGPEIGQSITLSIGMGMSMDGGHQ